MMKNRLRSPVSSVLNILEEYHKDAEARLKTYEPDDQTRNKIVTDIYAKDDIYMSLNRSYQCIEASFEDFCKERKLHHALPEMFSYIARGGRITLFAHQAQAIDSILAEHSTIISTGTGSGKTESFLIPILHHCLVQKYNNIPGIKAVILYPLNALANDQIHRIINAVKGRGIRVGCFVGSTAKYKERQPDDPEEECISRQEMIDQPPDILITNYVMLDRLITKPDTRRMFVDSEKTLKYIVVDEVHYFRGTKGANLSLLLRRFRTLCKQSLVQIGASGTLQRSGGYFPNDEQEGIEQFVRLIFGYEAVMKNGFQLIEPSFEGLEKIFSLDPLPATDSIEGDTILSEFKLPAAEKLYEQLSGRSLDHHVISIENHPMYHFALRSKFIARMRDKLVGGACTFNEIIALFCQLYRDTHQREPRNPRSVVEAYLSLIDYLNQRCEEKKENPLPLILDYRLHLILGNIGGSLTRCLLCKRYHDGRCQRCRHCSNGLLFKVSKEQPDQCIAYLAGRELFPTPPVGRHKFEVLVQASFRRIEGTGMPPLCFMLEPNIDIATDEESYLIRPAHDEEDGVLIRLPRNKQELHELPLNDPRLYWHNVLKVTDALVVRPETKTSDKLLGFIDNKERASAIKLRLNDEIAERTLETWAINLLSDEEEMNLVEAFKLLEKEMPPEVPVSSDEEEQEDAAIAPLREMPFWFSRMLTYLNEYKHWRVYIDESLSLQPDEYELLNGIMLREAASDRKNKAAIDRTSFWMAETEPLKHLYLEKKRVTTQYGVGLSSSNEPGYDIISLGQHGKLYKDYIQRAGSNIKDTLDTLTIREILVQKTTPAGILFYQLNPKHLMFKIVGEAGDWKSNFATVECHTADHSNELRTQIEERFNEGEIKALICTPTLEMGVDIEKLSTVLMIGFPPSPANYSQRAGRAGRCDKSRLATIVVLSSAEDMHDEYYYAMPYKMINGAITPPQFTLSNFALLSAHVYAHFAAGNKGLSLFYNPVDLQVRIRDFVDCDELHLCNELGKDYECFVKYVENDSQKLANRLMEGELSSLEQCYRQGIFPDYGFRRDGVPLLKPGISSRLEEHDENLLTVRESEEAPRKLVPGRVVFCGGRAVKVAEEQPIQTYEICSDPVKDKFRSYSYVVADVKDDVQIDKKRDPDTAYRLSRFLDLKEKLDNLSMQGPSYCRVYLVRQGKLFFINEGKLQQDMPSKPLEDQRGDYRFGTCLERDGLLICFADRILPPNMKANFLAVLLRGIPDYFDLDDSELRVVQHLYLYPQVEHETGERISYFIYGHDESGLVPFERIFENLEKTIRRALHNLETCSCGGEGCYLCLYSLNSHALTGRISHEGAVDCLSAYLRLSRLKPYIIPSKDVMLQADITLSLSVYGDKCQIVVENTAIGKREEHTRRDTERDYNTRIYTALREVLEQEHRNGARTVKIRSNIDHVCKQLRGENDVEKGREAFLNLWLTLLNWQAWDIERI